MQCVSIFQCYVFWTTTPRWVAPVLDSVDERFYACSEGTPIDWTSAVNNCLQESSGENFYGDKTLESCKQACLDWTDFDCLAILYTFWDLEEQVCKLFAVNSITGTLEEQCYYSDTPTNYMVFSERAASASE